ncbi:flagellar basal-body MS-ring/collar protein FliF [Thermohalobacter berrensis]|uniref:Flagellar M-ring protein n=1 Tax=Thermohalobacter berrensis TaxID=99594 RepID=A0A419TAE6_9FIRM|nr:flagellar basal-body MS-ring/collar protein FliF [Thermohalobacter berrensis]RKD34432.1 flagellar M-ring protein FliF [Thermohalobacter berrensis]
MGEIIAKIKKQLNEFWQGLDKNKKIKLGISSLFIVISMTAIIYFTTRTEYEVLYKNLTLKDTASITQQLDEMGVQWKSGDNETTILVPKGMKNKIKIELASEGLPKEGYSFLDAINSTSWTMTDYEKKQRLKLALQSELASTISEINGIEDAKVYIDIPEESGYILNEDTNAKASVFVKLAKGIPLSNAKVSAIKNLVAGAIKGMSIDNVTIIDDSGSLLTNDEDSLENYNLTEQLNIQQNIQNRINNSIKRFLENVFGYGNVDVRTNVKMNFDSEVTSIVQFSPPIEGNDEGLIRSMEEIEEEMVNGANGGVPGTESNTDEITDYAQIENENSKYQKASRVINYELNEINRQIKRAPGQIESVTVAILINEDSLVDGELTEEKEKEITNLIYAATGLNTKQVFVSASRFNKELIGSNENVFGDNEAQIPDNWYMWAIAIGALSIIGILSFVVYRRKTPKYDINDVLEEKSSEMEEVEEIDLDGDKSEVKKQIEKFVDKNPEAVAQLLRTWLNED